MHYPMKYLIPLFCLFFLACTLSSQAETPIEKPRQEQEKPAEPSAPSRPELHPTPVPVVDQVLTKAETETYLTELVRQWKDSVKVALQYQYEDRVLTIGENNMKIWWTLYGDKPSDGRSLYISLHGGGGAPASLNDQQWENQKKLYKPDEGVYLAPRAITNTWDLHFVPEADAFYERIIQMAQVYLDVNPDKVYLMGYSAGGDGVWRLGPRMADHWAAASMMAGHPGDVRLESLRNTPFMIWCGALDSAYNRNEECAKRIAEMDALQAADPEGYIHEGHIVEGKPHWMDLVDAAAVPWMAIFTRITRPDRVVWVQGDVMKPASYWLGVTLDEAAKGKMAVAVLDAENNTIVIEKSDYSRHFLYLDDAMMDLDKPVKVVYDGKELFNGPVTRNANTLRQTLIARGDPSYAFPAVVEVELK